MGFVNAMVLKQKVGRFGRRGLILEVALETSNYTMGWVAVFGGV